MDAFEVQILLKIEFLSTVKSVHGTANYVNFKRAKVLDWIYFATQKFIYLIIFILANE